MGGALGDATFGGWQMKDFDCCDLKSEMLRQWQKPSIALCAPPPSRFGLGRIKI